MHRCKIREKYLVASIQSIHPGVVVVVNSCSSCSISIPCKLCSSVASGESETHLHMQRTKSFGVISPMRGK